MPEGRLSDVAALVVFFCFEIDLVVCAVFNNKCSAYKQRQTNEILNYFFSFILSFLAEVRKLSYYF